MTDLVSGSSRPAPSLRFRSWTERIRRQLVIHRRLVAAVLTGLCVLGLIGALRPTPPPVQGVWVAAHDLAGGSPITEESLRRVRVPAELAPAEPLARSDLLGRRVAVAVAAGEPVVPQRLIGPAGAAGYPGRVALAVRLGDAELASALRDGDRIDLLGVDPERPQERAELVAADVLVLGRLSSSEAAGALGSAGSGVVMLFAVPEADAAKVAAAAYRKVLTVLWSR